MKLPGLGSVSGALPMVIGALLGLWVYNQVASKLP